jgi:hypothetical protein
LLSLCHVHPFSGLFMKPGNDPRSAASAGCLVLALVAAVGCGQGQRTGDVSGVVRLDGRPLASGQVTFLSQAPGARACFAAIADDGSYTIRNCPTGPAVISVETFAPANTPADFDEGKFDPAHPEKVPLSEADRKMRREKREEAEAAARKYVPIPARYRDLPRSGLSYTVVPGPQAYNLELNGSD